jgi:2-phosphosulfolactate phosphatase
MNFFRFSQKDLQRVLATCSSGRELIERGFASDVALAAEHDGSATVPLLHDAEYRDAGDR